MQVDLSPLTEHPLLRKLAPDVASAWADRLLSPAELTRLERRARRLRGITPRDLEALRAWLDPEAPPSARSLARLERGLRQRAPTPAEHAAPSDRVAAEPERRAGPSPRARRLRTLLDGRHSALRDEVRGLIAASDFTLPVAEERSQYRTQVLAWLRRVGELLDAAAGDGEPDLTRFIAAFETLAFHDLSLVVKVGVQFGLFCGAVEQLGTEVHRPLLASARALDQLGCFAMTERGHGSNVRDLETEARYDPASGGFVLHTPTLSAGKEWIGNAAVHARYAVVFAQLWVGDDCHGVHAFVTEIRDPHGAPRPGVRIEDCGPKMGLNGVDNGRLWFEHVALPREALLDRFGRVGAGGEYESDIPSPSRRFFTMLGTLVRGRVAVGGAAISAAKAGLAIALHYGARRRQLPSGGPEKRLLAYPHHRRRLLGHLAAQYAASFAQHELVDALASADGESERRRVETRAAALKAFTTERAVVALQAARECCGGQGYLLENRIAQLRVDAEVFTTFEGDNTVLHQLVAKDALGAHGLTSPLALGQFLARSAFERARARFSRPVRDAHGGYVHAPLLALLRLRAEALLGGLALRLGRQTLARVPVQDAFDGAQNAAIQAARAQAAYTVAEAFSRQAGEPALAPLIELHLIESVLDASSFYAESRLLAVRELRRLRARRAELEREIGERVHDYVDGLGVPAACLGPLADPSVLSRSGLAED